MGYTTELYGQFSLDKQLTQAHREYLAAFNATRRMKRDASKADALPDPLRKAALLPIGDEGEFFVGSTGDFGQLHTPDIIEYNTPPATQPGLWCQWIPTDDGMGIEWDGGEKFYHYTDWLVYLIDKFLQPWGYVLNGSVEWQGEDRDDRGMIVVTDNKVSTKTARVTFD